jgi:xylose dehydrogenase (NAD/NADP)
MKQSKLNWGILGAAKIVRSLAPAIRESRFSNAYAVASRSLTKAQAFAEEYGFERSYGSYQALLRDPDVDVIYIPLPNHLHCPWTIRALEAGKHVLCEKPLAINASECKKMIAAAKRNRRLLMEAFMYRLHPQTLKIRELLSEGAIGEVRIVRAAFGFYLDEGSPNVRLFKRMRGGCLMDVGCYCVNAIRTFFGHEPIAVMGYAARGKNTGVDMSFAGTLIFPGGKIGIFNSSFQSILDWGVEIVGTEGRILVPSPWKPNAELTSFTVEVKGRTSKVEIKKGGGIYHLEVDHFSQCILENKSPAMPPGEGLRNMAVIEALLKSARSGKRVRVTSKS